MLKILLPIQRLLKKISINNFFERGLHSLIIIFLITIFVTQIGLVSDEIRPYLSSIDVFEGKYINEIDNLVKEGTITLGLVDMNKDSDIKILVNGKVVSQFDKKFVDIKVRNNAIVEVDGSKLKNRITIKIANVSNEIKNVEINKQVNIESDIKFITRVRLK